MSDSEPVALSDQTEDLIRAVERILELFPDNCRSRGDDVSADILRAAVLRRASKSVRAAIALCRAGYDEQALMLARTVFEDMVNVHWIAVDPKRAVQHFHEAALLSVYRRSKLGSQYGFDAPQTRELTKEELACVRKLDKSPRNRSWSRGALRDRIKEIVEADMFGPPDGSEAKKLWFYFEVGMDVANGQVHSSPESIYGTIERGDHVPPMTVQFAPERSDRVAPGALVLVGYSIAHLYEQVARDFGLPESRERVDAYLDLERLAGEGALPAA